MYTGQVGTENSPLKTSEFSSENSMLNESILFQNSLIHQLEAILTPILSLNMEEKTGNAGQIDKSLSPLSDTIRNHRYSIESNNSRLQILLNRIEI